MSLLLWKESTLTFWKQDSIFVLFVQILKKYCTSTWLFFTFSPLKIRHWIRIRVRIQIHFGFQNPGSGSARKLCGSETRLKLIKFETLIVRQCFNFVLRQDNKHLAEGQVVLSQTITSKSRTVETTIYTIELEGGTETRLDQKVP